ncbi:hypothetical protein F2P81_024941 [Scophthalmus maximus]|uniref:Uncharacterized protein n=1 Tax=Scophthalmus maximus TaxID=52904 RepID=A0A6A4RUB2_SCOMX|nr:hypothetical protein F2P81_024941 [Scophthalmus maximus]
MESGSAGIVLRKCRSSGFFATQKEHGRHEELFQNPKTNSSTGRGLVAPHVNQLGGQDARARDWVTLPLCLRSAVGRRREKCQLHRNRDWTNGAAPRAVGVHLTADCSPPQANQRVCHLVPVSSALGPGNLTHTPKLVITEPNLITTVYGNRVFQGRTPEPQLQQKQAGERAGCVREGDADEEPPKASAVAAALSSCPDSGDVPVVVNTSVSDKSPPAAFVRGTSDNSDQT